METTEQTILATLTGEFQTAGKIASLCSRNYYVVKETLEELAKDNKLEKAQFHKRTKYRKGIKVATFDACPSPTNAPGQGESDNSHHNPLNTASKSESSILENSHDDKKTTNGHPNVQMNNQLNVPVTGTNKE